MPDVRLIDANKLMKKSRRMYAPDEIDSIAPIATSCVTVDDIHRAPVVDARPVVHGRWVLGVPITCSLCGKPAAQHDLPNSFWMSPYCPWCGQPMDATDNNVGNKDGGAANG